MVHVVLLFTWFACALGGCSNNDDCSLLGQCTAGSCVCRDGWKGSTCVSADLTPLDITLGYQNPNASSWGGRPIKDPKSGQWQLMVTEFANHCPLDLFQYNSQIIRAVSDTLGGPYQRAEVVFPPFHHNPTFVGPTPDGMYLLFFIGNGNASNVVDCTSGVPPVPLPSWPNTTRQHVDSNGYISMAWTKDIVNGPWQQRVILRDNQPGENMTSWHCMENNPSAHILKNGTVVLIYRSNICRNRLPPGTKPPAGSGEHLGVAVAPHWSGEFIRDPTPIATPLSTGSGNEDPFLWLDERDGGSWHIINHQQGKHNVCGGKEAGWSCGAHFFARDPHGPWTMSTSPVYTENVTLVNGSTARFQARQRPQLVFAEDGVTPSFLFFAGSFDGINFDLDMHSYTYANAFVQPHLPAGSHIRGPDHAEEEDEQVDDDLFPKTDCTTCSQVKAATDCQAGSRKPGPSFCPGTCACPNQRHDGYICEPCPASAPTPPPPAPVFYHCESNKCVRASSGVSKKTCKSVCGHALAANESSTSTKQ